MNGSSPTLTLFCGLPGAGKTTLAERLEAEGRGVRLCTDDWQAGLRVEHNDGAFHERLQALLRRHGMALLRQGIDVILEDGLWQASERAELFAQGRACGARIELHVFDVDLETLWTRLAQRNRDDIEACPMTRADLESAWAAFQPPSATELEDVDSYVVRAARRF